MTLEDLQREANYTQRISELTRLVIIANNTIEQLNSKIKELENKGESNDN